MCLRRLVIGGILATMLVVLAAAPSSGGTIALNRRVDGDFTGTGTAELFANGCDYAYATQDWAYGAGKAPRTGIVHLEICHTRVNLVGLVATGSFVLVTGTGARLA